MKITVRILRGDAEYAKVLKNPMFYMHTPIWKLGWETMKQLQSEQWLKQNGFKRVD